MQITGGHEIHLSTFINAILINFEVSSHCSQSLRPYAFTLSTIWHVTKHLVNIVAILRLNNSMACGARVRTGDMRNITAPASYSN